MKRELYVLYVGYTVFYFGTRLEAGLAAAAMASAMSADGAANPDAKDVRLTLAPVSPRIERVFLEIPRRSIAGLTKPAQSKGICE
jgi:hypothetical protein